MIEMERRIIWIDGLGHKNVMNYRIKDGKIELVIGVKPVTYTIGGDELDHQHLSANVEELEAILKEMKEIDQLSLEYKEIVCDDAKILEWYEKIKESVGQGESE